MKNRNGFISIISLMVMSISMIIILEVIVIVKMHILMLNSSENKIQSNYCAEDKILMSMYDDKYYTEQSYPILLEIFRKHNFDTKLKEITIDQSDLDEDDSYNKVEVSFQDKNNRKELVLKTQSNYKNIKSRVKGSANLVNPLFEMEKTILDVNTIEEEYKDQLESLLLNIDKNIKSKNIDKTEFMHTSELCGFNSVLLEKTNANLFKLVCKRDTMINPYIEGFNKREIFIVVKKLNEKEVTLYIDSKENLMNLSGIIYVEGDMNISSDFTFNGIIIIKDGKILVDSEAKPKINGTLIFSNTDSMEEIETIVDLNYNRFSVYKYGSFLPGFLDINLNLIKSSD